MSDNRPIGVFDSGLGGLTVVKELVSLIPGERIIYLGDTARCPYGGRSNETITIFGKQDAGFLLHKNIKMLIVACNTVSSVALDEIRKNINDIPVLGVIIPGCKAAVEHCGNGKIGVIGTTATIKANAYQEGIKRIDKSMKVYSRACPLFVPIVEEGLEKSEIASLAVQHYLYDLVDLGIDTLILGCTHYPLLMEVIQSNIGNQIELIDSAMWTAREAARILSALELENNSGENGLQNSIFYLTDKNPNFEKTAERFLGYKLPAVKEVSVEELRKLSL